ncbi:MAG: phosphatidylserine decarboxylase, partial [Desulfobacterales bacterium]|nr:phosphatidylserine decarboxylase [Desulfobacterales bacterium]
MAPDPDQVTACADARVLTGSFAQDHPLFIKEKFFTREELLGLRWASAFSQGDFAIFRLTPDKYHYVHTPVAGRVVDIYEIEGAYHSCNPGAVVSLAQPFSKNKRGVTIIDTDCPEGTGVGLVAHI